MPTVLDKIVESKGKEVECLKESVPLSELEQCIVSQAPPLNFGGALWGDEVRLIGEVKKASPSKGALRNSYDPVALATTYVQNGAAAVSVLTETHHFQGSIDHLASVGQAIHPLGAPVLRKDFILEPYQVYEARAYGADAILLIVSILLAKRLEELLKVSQNLWMQCLVEVHDREELKVALECGAEVIGINNRDLRTFNTDLSVTEELVPLIPKGKIIVSESGISSRDDVLRLKRLGVHAALVGEALLTAPDVAAKVRELT